MCVSKLKITILNNICYNYRYSSRQRVKRGRAGRQCFRPSRPKCTPALRHNAAFGRKSVTSCDLVQGTFTRPNLQVNANKDLGMICQLNVQLIEMVRLALHIQTSVISLPLQSADKSLVLCEKMFFFILRRFLYSFSFGSGSLH